MRLCGLFVPDHLCVLAQGPCEPGIEGSPESCLCFREISTIAIAVQLHCRKIGACQGPQPDMLARAPHRPEDAPSGVTGNCDAKILVGASFEVELLADERLGIESVVHGKADTQRNELNRRRRVPAYISRANQRMRPMMLTSSARPS